MEGNKAMQSEVKQLVREFKQNKEKGEFRNKIGRILWPCVHAMAIPLLSTGVVVSGVATGNVFGVIFGVSMWAGCRFAAKGLAINVQNIAIKNAGILGRSLKERQISREVRREAVLEYLRQSGCWFLNRKWVKQHPEEINKMAVCQKGENIFHPVALAEHDLNRIVNHKIKLNGKISLKERWDAYLHVFRTVVDQMRIRKHNRGISLRERLGLYSHVEEAVVDQMKNEKHNEEISMKGFGLCSRIGKAVDQMRIGKHNDFSR